MKLKNHTSRKSHPSLTRGAWLLIISFLLSCCTLSMEDYLVPEEERGFDEAETVQNEFGSVTYQFKDGVRSITENIQEYIVEVEDDSVIYFMDNTPKDWLPRVGDLVSAMCSPVIPFGLNHRVIDVRDVGGLYKVTCTGASRDEIFEKLIIDLDYELTTPDIPVYDSLYLDSLGIKAEDLVIEDLSLLEDYYGSEAMAKAKKPRRAYRKTANWKHTRAALELPNEVLATRGEQSSDSVMYWRMDKLTFTEPTTKTKFALAGVLEKHSRQHVIYKEDKEEDYKKQVTTDKSYDIWKVSSSITAGKSVFKPHDTQEIKKLKELKQALKNLALVKPKGKKPIVGGKILFPIPFMPAVSVAFNISGNISFEGAVCVDVTVRQNHPETETVYEYKDGKEIYYPTKQIKSGNASLTDLQLYGSLSLSVQARAGIGIEITGTGIGGDVGIGITGKITLKAPLIEEQQYTDETTASLITDNSYLTLESFFFIDGCIYISPAGLELLKYTYTFLKETLFKTTLYPIPQVDKNLCKHTYTIQNDQVDNSINWTLFKTSMGFSHLWSIGPPSNYCFPRMRVYLGGYGGECEVLKLATGEHAAVKEDETYSFEKKIETGRYDKIIFVPCIFDAMHSHYYEFRESAMTFGDAKPSFTFVKEKSRVSLSINKYFEEEIDGEEEQQEFLKEYGLDKLPAWMRNLDKWFFHEHALAIDIKNMGMVEQWGMKVVVTSYPNGVAQKLIEKDVYVSKRNTYLKAGKKTIVCSFVTNWPQWINITFTPFTVDQMGNKTYYKSSIGPFTIPENKYRSTWNWKDWPGAMIQTDLF